MVHPRQRRLLHLEAGLVGAIEAIGADDLERHALLDRFAALGQVDEPHAALADAFENAERTDVFGFVVAFVVSRDHA